MKKVKAKKKGMGKLAHELVVERVCKLESLQNDLLGDPGVVELLNSLHLGKRKNAEKIIRIICRVCFFEGADIAHYQTAAMVKEARGK